MKPPALLLLLAPFLAAIAGTPAGVPAPAVETDMSHEGWYAELPPALAEARKTGKDMLIDFGGSDWCAPCKFLKYNILVKPEFIERASASLILVDIDTLSRGLSPERKARYVKLQEQYKVGTFPSVFLTTPEGLPYAWTTYIPPKEGASVEESFKIGMEGKLDTPERFWAQIEPLLARGNAFREGLARAGTLSGQAKADAMIDALSQVRADFLDMHYADRIAELQKLDPADHRGFIAYLAGCKAYNALEMKSGAHYDLSPEVKVADVDALIAKYRLQGETLQQALAMKATLLVMDGKPGEALEAFSQFVEAQKTRGPFDRGDYLPVTPATIAILKRRLAEAGAKNGGEAAQYLALHHIFENQELPSRYRISCRATETSSFIPAAMVRGVISDGYGNALLKSTASLQGEVRARALAEGLKGTSLNDAGPIGTIISEVIPGLIGRENAVSSLPEPYSGWVRHKWARQN